MVSDWQQDPCRLLEYQEVVWNLDHGYRPAAGTSSTSVVPNFDYGSLMLNELDDF